MKSDVVGGRGKVLVPRWVRRGFRGTRTLPRPPGEHPARQSPTQRQFVHRNARIWACGGSPVAASCGPPTGGWSARRARGMLKVLFVIPGLGLKVHSFSLL